MTKLPFFISAPRTRSSILFETMAFYINQHCNLKSLDHHTELFLTKSVWANIQDKRTGEWHDTQLLPNFKNGKITMHHVYPPMFDNVQEANLFKLDTLAEAKDYDIEFNIKGTVQIIENYKEILEFFSDRKFIITKRHDVKALIASTLFALSVKAFHVRPNNIDVYNEHLSKGVLLSEELITLGEGLLVNVKRLWELEDYILDNGWDLSVVYYEDLNDEAAINNTITDILETADWIKYLPDDYHSKVPMKLDNDYTTLIHNYDELTERLDKIK